MFILRNLGVFCGLGLILALAVTPADGQSYSAYHPDRTSVHTARSSPAATPHPITSRGPSCKGGACQGGGCQTGGCQTGSCSSCNSCEVSTGCYSGCCDTCCDPCGCGPRFGGGLLSGLFSRFRCCHEPEMIETVYYPSSNCSTCASGSGATYQQAPATQPHPPATQPQALPNVTPTSYQQPASPYGNHYSSTPTRMPVGSASPRPVTDLLPN